MCQSRNFRGVRAYGPYDDDFKRGLRVLEARGLSVDVWNLPSPGYVPGELPKLSALASEFPKVTFVLNHLGGLIGPAMGGDSMEGTWRQELADIARCCPNVTCKVGGIFMPINGWGLHTRATPAGSQELADLAFPYFSYAIKCFGTERCMFESNFPVDKESATYRTVWNMFKHVASRAALTEHQKADIFHNTAIRVYRLRLESKL